MGPISENCQEVLGNFFNDFSSIVLDFTRISEFLNNTSSSYQMGDYNASNLITGSGGNFGASGARSVMSSSGGGGIVYSSYSTGTGNSNVDVSAYSSNPGSGFNVTTGHTSYSLSSSDVDLLYAIVAAESDKSYDDALAVITTILNRCESPNWVANHGSNPVTQATAPNQFVVYQHGSYRSYINGNAPETVKRAVNDALGGVRNHEYLSFRSNSTTGYSNNMITSTGNRYK